jgi:hypothetical protein
MVNLIIDQGLVVMSEWSEKNDRQDRDMQIMADPKYNTKYFVHRVIRFLRDHPERATDYEDFVPDWQTRKLDE